MLSWKNDRIGSCERGENPTLLVQMKSGFAVMGDSQFLPGYCILLAYPAVTTLNALASAERQQFLYDMALLGDAIIRSCNPLRINYAIMANLDHFLHAHVWARYEYEPEEYSSKTAWDYPKEQYHHADYHFNEEKHGELKNSIKNHLCELMAQNTTFDSISL